MQGGGNLAVCTSSSPPAFMCAGNLEHTQNTHTHTHTHKHTRTHAHAHTHTHAHREIETLVTPYPSYTHLLL